MRVQNLILSEVLKAPASVRVDAVIGHGRAAILVRLRWRIWSRQRNELTKANGQPNSWPHIGRMWRRDHTTIMHGVARYESEAIDRPSELDPDWSAMKQAAYNAGRTAHAERYRALYPHLGLPHTRTST